MAVILDNERRWECPSCGRQKVTRTRAVTTELHACPGQRGMIVPYVQVDSKDRLPTTRHVIVERGDYVGDELGVRHDAEGTAVMAVHTERADGSHDTHVFATTAQAHIEGVS